MYVEVGAAPNVSGWVAGWGRQETEFHTTGRIRCTGLKSWASVKNYGRSRRLPKRGILFHFWLGSWGRSCLSNIDYSREDDFTRWTEKYLDGEDRSQRVQVEENGGNGVYAKCFAFCLISTESVDN